MSRATLFQMLILYTAFITNSICCVFVIGYCRVDVTSRWTEEGGSEVEVLVGFVSGVGGGRGVVSCDEREISFPSDVATSISGYHPHVNDWVKVRYHGD